MKWSFDGFLGLTNDLIYFTKGFNTLYVISDELESLNLTIANDR